MTRKFLMLTTAGVLLGAAALALAPDASARWGDDARGGKDGWHRGHGGHEMHGHHGRKGGGVRMLKRLDADGNGEVTLEEAHKARDERFTELDKDKNGALSADELVARAVEKMDYMQRRHMKDLDTNADGKVTKEDFEAAARERFAARDFNGNGTIEADEMPPRQAKGWRRGKGRDWDDDRRGPRREGRGRNDGGPDSAEMDGEESGPSEDAGQGDHRGRRGERTLETAMERAGRHFARMDDNKDGVISPDEIASTRAPQRLDYMKRARLSRFDTDKNGSVSKEEFRAGADKRFARMDLDGDGRITAADLPPGAAKRWEMNKDKGGAGEAK